MSKARHARPPKMRKAAKAAGVILPGIASAAIIASPAHAATLGQPDSTIITLQGGYNPPYTVQPGDTLAGIAQLRCGNPADWTGIFQANRGKISDPDLIYSGEQLTLDCRQVNTITADPAIGADPVSAVPDGTFSFSGLESLWEEAGGPAWAAPEMATIAQQCESGGNPGAYNPDGASGLWQILGLPFPGDPFNPQVNAEMAVAKFRDAGDSYAPWSGDGCV